VTSEELTDLVDRLLEVGVPPTAVAKAFDVDPFVIRDRQSELRVSQYGAPELAEAMANLQWMALAEARHLMYDAPYSVRSRFLLAMITKTMSLTARQSPETMGTLRKDLLELMRAVEDDDADYNDALATVNPSAFVAVTASNEDQDQGSDG
jgi:hypothetical protein